MSSDHTIRVRSVGGKPRRPVIDRFMEKARQTEDGCWGWAGLINDAGYALLACPTSKGKPWRNLRASRVAYELFVGPIPTGLTIDHLCRNRSCVNPKHLEPVTRGENVRRASIVRRTGKCRRGHPVGARTPRNKSNKTDCKLCAAHRRANPTGRKRPSPKQRGECNHRAIATVGKVLEAFRMAAAGATTHEIAERLGLGRRSVKAILCRQTWSWVEVPAEHLN